jgi:hypothetical protein
MNFKRTSSSKKVPNNHNHKGWIQRTPKCEDEDGNITGKNWVLTDVTARLEPHKDCGR